MDFVLALVITLIVVIFLAKIISMAVIALAGLGGALLIFLIVFVLLKARKLK